jgi:tripartite-type tricarboxylate transporter receptor subunit TctC
LRALAVFSQARSSHLPDVPTIAEAGVPNIVVTDWQGILAPRATPQAIVAKVAGDVRRVLTAPASRERLALSGFEVVASTPEAFRLTLGSEVQRWAKVVREANIKVE